MFRGDVSFLDDPEAEARAGHVTSVKAQWEDYSRAYWQQVRCTEAPP